MGPDVAFGSRGQLGRENKNVLAQTVAAQVERQTAKAVQDAVTKVSDAALCRLWRLH
jgi:hypothetical protein